MTLIFETKNFIIEAEDKPHIDREDGGHIIITPKVRVRNRQQLSSELAVELMKLTILVGEAMTNAMNKRGVEIGRINYQDNGNWNVLDPEGPYLHFHLYGRAKNAKFQKYGEACYFPSITTNPEYYDRFSPLNIEDIEEIRIEIDRLLQTAKYKSPVWSS